MGDLFYFALAYGLAATVPFLPFFVYNKVSPKLFLLSIPFLAFVMLPVAAASVAFSRGVTFLDALTLNIPGPPPFRSLVGTYTMLIWCIATAVMLLIAQLIWKHSAHNKPSNTDASDAGAG